MITRSEARAVPPADFGGLSVLILGLGGFGGGIGAARFFAERRARVVITDRRPAAELATSIAQLADLQIAGWTLGDHRDEDIRAAEWLVVNPAVPPRSRQLELARELGVRVVTEVGLFLDWCRSRHVAAITGSNGKSTTTKLTHDMLRAGGHTVHLGGNIGVSLLPQIDLIEPEHRVVLELSSFQLERLDPSTPLPHAVAITHFAPNHLDWHGDVDAYLRAKERILGPRAPGEDVGAAVLPAAAEEFSRWSALTSRTVMAFAADHCPAGGIGYEDGWLVAPCEGRMERIARAGALTLRGDAGRAATACATGLALALGATPAPIAATACNFRALPHRQEPIAERGGVFFVNDSKATTPEATVCALESYEPQVILLAGGSAKGASFDRLGAEIARRARAVVLFGATAAAIEAAALAAGMPRARVRCMRDLGAAFAAAVALARSGDTVLLSPACASYDQFANYEERGELFRSLASKWAQATCVEDSEEPY